MRRTVVEIVYLLAPSRSAHLLRLERRDPAPTLTDSGLHSPPRGSRSWSASTTSAKVTCPKSPSPTATTTSPRPLAPTTTMTATPRPASATTAPSAT